MNQITDPREIPQNDMPFHFVLSNQTTSLISFLIDWKTNANFDHCMQSINQGKFITQDFGGYHEIPMDQYLKRGGELKFIKITNATPKFNQAFRDGIIERLKQPWYKKIYDYGNILGRAIGINWIHLPGTYDCSEVSLYMIKKYSMYLLLHDQYIINTISDRTSPDDIDQVVKNNPTVFTLYGQWEADNGVIA